MHEDPTNMTRSPEGGLLIRVKNSTPAPLLQGYVVKADVNNDDSVVLTAVSDPDPVGIVYQDIPIGAYGWIIVAGIGDVYVDNAGATAREAWIGVSTATPGNCTSGGIPAIIADHFRECGHTIRARAGAGLVRSIIHFN